MSTVEQRTLRETLTGFEYGLADLLSSHQHRIPKQLERKEAMAMVRSFMERRYPLEKKNSLRRFLSGEFTEGIVPIVIGDLHRRDVEQVLAVLDVTEAIAELKDLDPERFSLAKFSAPPVEEIVDAESEIVDEPPDPAVMEGLKGEESSEPAVVVTTAGEGAALDGNVVLEASLETPPLPESTAQDVEVPDPNPPGSLGKALDAEPKKRGGLEVAKKKSPKKAKRRKRK